MKVGLWLFVALSFALSSAAACVRPASTVPDSLVGRASNSHR